MAIAQAEHVDNPSEMSELARAGWLPSTVGGFTDMSFMGRHRLGQWVETARAEFASLSRGRGGGGRGRGYPPQAAGVAAPQPKPKWAGRPQREPLPDPAEALAEDPAAWADAGDGEARVSLTYALRIVLILQN